MANIAFQRLQREFKEVMTSAEIAQTGIRLEMRDDNFTHLHGEIRGPPESPYEDGTFQLAIEIPNTYPFHPPKIRFETKIWHPNISSQTGTICLDILKDQWAASMTLRTVLLSIQALLTAPEPNDPQVSGAPLPGALRAAAIEDAVVASQCLTNAPLFRETARLWAQVFAAAPGVCNGALADKLRKVKELGVSQERAAGALSCNGWDVDKAIENLFG